jgi:hypothetical protein
MIAAPPLDAASADFFEAIAAHCDEAASSRDGWKRKRRQGASPGGVRIRRS